MSGKSEELVLLVDDDFSVRTAIAAALERPGRRIITCSDLESAEILIETLPIDTAIADLRLSGPFGTEGLDLISFAMEKQPGTHVVLISGHTSRDLPRETSEASQVTDMPALDAILVGQHLSNVFQPIVSTTGEVFGYESLARVSGSAPLNDPQVLFQYAERKRRLLDLELACIQSTFKTGQQIPPAVRLFVNVHPHALSLGSRFVNPFIAVAGRLNVALHRIVLEITEQAPLGNDAGTNSALTELHDRGVSFAFDDVGIRHSHYLDLLRVRPSFLKISNHFGTNFERDSYRSRIVRNIVSLAEDFGIDVILEGVESESTAHAAARIGVRLMQGFWFGRPVEAAQLANDLTGVN